MDKCLSETIASFNLTKTPQNENEAKVNTGTNIQEDGDPEIAVSKAGQPHVSKNKIMTTIHVHDIDGIAISEMGYQADDEEMDSVNGTGKLFNRKHFLHLKMNKVGKNMAHLQTCISYKHIKSF